MKILGILIRVDLVLLFLLGRWATFYSDSAYGVGPGERYYQDAVFLKFLGTSQGMLAIAFFLVGNLALIGHGRRLGVWLAFSNLVLAMTMFVNGYGKSLVDWFLLLVPLAMAPVLAWASLRPLKPEEAAAELAALKIPDEVRQALLPQVKEAAAQEERNRLARDLHDSIKQQLFTINVSAATAQERWERDPQGAQAALADVRRSAREAMAEMQAMLHQLRPQALASTVGLVGALREQAEALGYRSGARVRVALGVEVPDDRMFPGTQEALFRIAI